MKTELAGSTCLVTGATSGIGYETAVGLAALGARVLVHGRSAAKAEAAAADVARRAGGSAAVEAVPADLSSLAEVRALAATVAARPEPLHVLVNNAGGYVPGKRRLTVDGCETTFGVNHLAPFLLTNLLLPRLTEAGGRVVTVASEAHRTGRADFANLQGEQRYQGWQAYCNSKLLNILFTIELARRIEGTGVTANSLHPGVIFSSGLWKGPLGGFLSILGRPFAVSAAAGARTSIYLAASSEVDGISGLYYIKQRPRRPAPQGLDHVAAARLWEVSEALLETAAPTGGMTGPPLLAPSPMATTGAGIGLKFGPNAQGTPGPFEAPK